MGHQQGTPSPQLPGTRGAPARSRRGLLLDAVAEVVREHGYHGASVSRIAAAAGVSRNAFYEHFANKEECFLAAYDESVEEALRLIRAAARADDGWERQLEAGVAAFLAYAASRPARAWLCIVEPLAAGPRALARRDAALRAFAAALDRCRDGRRASAPSLLTELVAGGVYEVVYRRILAGRAASLPELLPAVMYVWLAPLAGPERAAAAARAAARRQAGGAAGPPALAIAATAGAVTEQDTDVS